MSWRPKALVLFTALAWIAVTPVRAETVTFAAGPIYGGYDLQDPQLGYCGYVTCRIWNKGTAAKLTQRRIYTNTNEIVEQNHAISCGRTLKAREYCSYGHTFTKHLAFVCSITVEATTASIVGVAEIRTCGGLFGHERVVNVVPFSR